MKVDTMEKVDKTDYKQELKHLYSAKAGKIVIVQVPTMNFIMVDGKGDPNTGKEYSDAIQCLYPVAYAIKFINKIKYGKDFGVMPLEGLWWTKNMENFSASNKNDWLWTAMIMQPDIITEDIYKQAVQQVREKKHSPSLDKLRFAPYDEGRAAQILYIGPYAGEEPTIQQLHAFIKEQGGQLTARSKHHHEIYLSDPRRTAPEKLKTIIRQPF